MRTLVALTVLLAAVPAAAETWVVAAGSTVRILAEHPFQSVVVESHAPEGRLRWSPAAPADLAGWIEQPLSVAWSTFDSGNANRDAVIRERVRAHRFPAVFVVAEALGAVVTGPAAITAEVTARIYVGGRMQRVSARVELRQEREDLLALRARLPLRMSDFAIEPPALLFLTAADDIVVEMDLRLRAAPVSAPRK